MILTGRENGLGHGCIDFFKDSAYKGTLLKNSIKRCEEYEGIYMDWDDEADCMVIQDGNLRIELLKVGRSSVRVSLGYARRIWEKLQYIGFTP
jgi:hypothetical protein